MCSTFLSVLRNTTLDTHSGSWKAPRTLLLQYPMYHPQLVNVDEPNTTSTAVSCLTHPREAVVMRSVVHAEHGVEHGRRGCHSRQELPISEGLRLQHHAWKSRERETASQRFNRVFSTRYSGALVRGALAWVSDIRRAGVHILLFEGGVFVRSGGLRIPAPHYCMYVEIDGRGTAVMYVPLGVEE